MLNPVKVILLLLASFLLAACANIMPPTYSGPFRSFETSFETETDFQNFYIVTPGDYDSFHELSAENVYSGSLAHKAWILKARADNNDGIVYLPHRAYPAIQLQKTENGIFRTPTLVTIWVNLDINLVDYPSGSIDDWFSFITVSPDASDNWARTVVINLTPDGYIKLVHVPNQSEQQRIYQADSSNDPSGALLFPQNEWVRLDLLIDFDPFGGYAKVWQNGTLVSYAKVNGGNSGLAQAHFGLYAAAAVPSGVIYNDDLRIKEVADEDEAITLINSPW